MRILFHGINFTPEPIGIGKFTGDMAAWLVARGHSVHVVTAPPYYPDWKIQGDHKAFGLRRELIDGAVVWRSPVWVPPNPGGATRLVHLASFAAASVPLMLAQLPWKPEIVITIAPTLFSAVSGALVAKLSGAASILHIQDFEVDAAFELGILPKGAAQDAALLIERNLLKRFDRVSTISERMAARLADKGLPDDRILLLPNWVDCEAIRPLPKPSPFRAELGIAEDAIVALYSGAIGQKQGLETIVESAKRLSARKNLLFIVAGAEGPRAKFEALAKGVRNIRWLPLQPVERLNDWLNLADIHLLPQRAGAADLVMPSKLTGMLASGKPVVAMATAGTQLHETVQGCGIAVAPESTAELVAAITRLAEQPALRTRLGKAARQRGIEIYGRDAVLGRFERDIGALHEDRQSAPSSTGFRRGLRDGIGLALSSLARLRESAA